ncbi:hypothetical protein Btru_038828 [Bulinus truncatus]|nr:hypothetical protein Btru_038828 [Bulinus truncatus]
MHPAIPISLVFIGCCSNVIFLEELVKVYPHSGNTITFFAFVFNCIEGLVFTTRFLTKPSAIPMRYYFLMVTFFFIVQTLNNYTFGFNISMPLHMIFRAGSLIANLILGVLIMKKEYKITKYLSVILITIGIAICTIASANQNEKMASHTGDAAYDYMIWVIGLLLLVLSLFLSARMGIFQEQTYAKFGKHPSEALFYNHFLPLPGFLLIASDILGTLREFNQSDMYSLPYFTISLPWAWLWLFFNTVSQFVCIKSVFILTTECTSLTVTLVVTLRKFISLVFSIIYFKNPFTLSHWFGAALVFLGTLMFVEIFNRFEPYRKLEETLSGERKKKDVPTRIQDDPTRIQDVPARIQDVPTRIQDDPTRIQDVPTRIQDDPTRIQDVPTRIQDVPARIQDVPTRIQDVPARLQDVPTRIQDVPARIQDVPARIQDVPKM